MSDVVDLFARRVRTERKRQGLSQEARADLAGLHRTYVGGLERGEINATLRSAGRISAALGVALAELLTDTDHTPSPTSGDATCRESEHN